MKFESPDGRLNFGTGEHNVNIYVLY